MPTGEREKLRYVVILVMCSGAVLGATLTLWTVAPVIALAATVVATSAAIFAFGPVGNATWLGGCWVVDGSDLERADRIAAKRDPAGQVCGMVQEWQIYRLTPVEP